MNNLLSSLLCCPKCRSNLTAGDQRMHCPVCREYALVEERFIDFDRLNPNLPLAVDWRIEAILKNIQKNVRGSVCLEIGGADGPMTPSLENLFDTTLSIDYSKHFLKRIQNKTQRALCIYANAQFLPVQDSVIDMVICCEVLEHSTIPTQLLTEIRRCVKNDGLIILSVPNEQVFFPTRPKIIDECRQAGDTHINFFTIHALEKLLFRTGLEPIDIKTISPPIRSFRMVYGKMRRYVQKCFSGEYIVCLAKPMDNPWRYWEAFNRNLQNNKK